MTQNFFSTAEEFLLNKLKSCKCKNKFNNMIYVSGICSRLNNQHGKTQGFLVQFTFQYISGSFLDAVFTTFCCSHLLVYMSEFLRQYGRIIGILHHCHMLSTSL